MITLTRSQLVLVAVPLLALLAVAGSRLAGLGASEGPSAAAPLAHLEAGGAETAPRLVVHVVGAVRRSGLFRRFRAGGTDEDDTPGRTGAARYL